MTNSFHPDHAIGGSGREDSSKIVQLAKAWLADAASTVVSDIRSRNKIESDLFDALCEQGHLTDEQVRCSYIEPGCVEHNVIHVHVWSSPADTAPYWLTVDPTKETIYKV